MVNEHGITYYIFENNYKIMGVVQLDGDELLCDITVGSFDEVKTIDENQLMVGYLQKIAVNSENLHEDNI